MPTLAVYAQCIYDIGPICGYGSRYLELEPDACPINNCDPGARLTLHEDKNERSFDHPIVSVSPGIPATFLFGGEHRYDPVRKIPLCMETLLSGAVMTACNATGSRN